MKERILKVLLPATLGILLLLPHFLFFDRGYVDFESIYAQSGSQIAEHGLNADLSEYFTKVANPVFTSLLLSAGYRLFGESPTASRLTTFFLPFIFSLFLYFYLRRRGGVFGAFVAVLLIIVNPIFIFYSKYIGSDAPFMVFSSTSLLLLLYANSLKGKGLILSSIMLGISLATKYLALFLFPVALICAFVKSKIFSDFSRTKLFSIIRFDLWYFVLALLVSAPFLAIGFMFLGGISSPEYGLMFIPNVGLVIPRFFAYLMWLGLFVGPFFLILVLDLWKRIGKIQFFILLFGLVALTLVVSLFFPISSLHAYGGDVGEMNFGWLEPYLSQTYLDMGLFFALLVAEIFVVSLTLDLRHHRDDKIVNLFCWILVPILLMSLLRGAQRYLLNVLLPLSLYMAFVAERMYSERTKSFVLGVLALHVVVFLYVGVLLLTRVR